MKRHSVKIYKFLIDELLKIQQESSASNKSTNVSKSKSISSSFMNTIINKFLCDCPYDYMPKFFEIGRKPAAFSESKLDEKYKSYFKRFKRKLKTSVPLQSLDGIKKFYTKGLKDEAKVMICFQCEEIITDTLVELCTPNANDLNMTSDLTKSIVYAIVFYIYDYCCPFRTHKRYDNIQLLNLLGTKWKKNMIVTNRSLMFANKYNYVLELFGGGLGLSMNLTSGYNHLIINDYDTRKANLFLCLKLAPMELVCKLYTTEYSETAFENAKVEEYTTTKQDVYNGKYNIDEAAKFLFLSAFSYMSKGKTFMQKASSFKLIKRIYYIPLYSQKLAKAKIINEDCIYVLKHIDEYIPPKNQKSSLIIADPPYWKTAQYRKNNDKEATTFTFESHKRLINSIFSFPGKYLYYYRNNKDINELFYEKAKELKQNIVRNCNSCKDVYYINVDIPMANKKVILDDQNNIVANENTERIITNIDFPLKPDIFKATFDKFMIGKNSSNLNLLPYTDNIGDILGGNLLYAIGHDNLIGEQIKILSEFCAFLEKQLNDKSSDFYQKFNSSEIDQLRFYYYYFRGIEEHYLAKTNITEKSD